MPGGVKVRELDAAAEAGDEQFVAAGFLADEFRGGIDVRFEKIIGPIRQLGKIALRRLRRDKMRAIVHRPHVHALPGQIDLERVAWILERQFAIHVGAGQIEHDRIGMRRRIPPLCDPMQRDFIERRFAHRRSERPFVNSHGAFQYARAADGAEFGVAG